MLARETYKWLQSLDLKVKNPKRDFANGVIIAEIFSRYFPNQLNIDLFYSGSGMEQKQNNWLQLQKFFKKNDINIPPEAVNAVMTCQPNAAILFVENIHRLDESTCIPGSQPAPDLFDTAMAPPHQADDVVREYKARFKTRVVPASPKIVNEGRSKSHNELGGSSGRALDLLGVHVNAIEIMQRN
ncbi:hypothetical protein BCR33DRAFT_715549 [Rhizoclosmatium globosum]|uniref:CH-like domain-containing protein n=1 Tax=Rhizoclosmatium globosum TaxID=329046 RepID=A0A1Y2CHQ5_9FUNG|nr:hypothetical protein BCR33DRAFT_715549 [Rhizoclosmatium globosum]|eukprot:ORY46476.1 hypothetical protein BCR33DRAFT_715549 [Rhizoclosmatium globosum]